MVQFPSPLLSKLRGSDFFPGGPFSPTEHSCLSWTCTLPTASGPPRSSGDLDQERRAVLRPASRSVDPSFGRAGEEQFFVPTLRVHVLRSWFRIEDIRARTRSRIRALRDDRGCRDKCPTTKNGTDVRSPSIPIFASRLRVVFNYDFGLRWLSLSLLSVDGGPLTDNVVLSSDQRVLVLKRTAKLQGEIPCRSITG